MKMISLTLILAAAALSGASSSLAVESGPQSPSVAGFKDTCNPSECDPCKVGDCMGGDMLGRDGAWHSNKACLLTASASGATGPNRLSSGSTGAGPVGSGPAGISDQAAQGNLTSFLPTAQSDSPCRSPMPGVLIPVAKGCRIPIGQDQWCRAGGGRLVDSGGKRFCLPQGATGAR